MFCDSRFGWPGVYYFHAFVSTLLFTAFFLFYRNNPNKHPLVNDLEKEKIGRGRDVFDSKAVQNVPYK